MDRTWKWIIGVLIALLGIISVALFGRAAVKKGEAKELERQKDAESEVKDLLVKKDAEIDHVTNVAKNQIAKELEKTLERTPTEAEVLALIEESKKV